MNIAEKFTPEQEPNSGNIRKTMAEWGVVGIFDEYPPEVDKQLAEMSRGLGGRLIQDDKGHRDKLNIDLQIPGKKILHLIVKANPADELRQSGEYGKKELKYSVLNELLANRIAAFRYQRYFGKQLPIEKSVGYVILKDVGVKCTLFEKVNKRTYKDNYAIDFPPGEEDNDGLIKRLKSLGITPTDFEIVWLHGKSEKDSQWFIVDTELWKIDNQ